jgi:hypothetical protein
MPRRVRLRTLRSTALAFRIRFLSKVFTVDRHQVESESHCVLVIHPTMQCVEVGRTIGIEPDDFGIEDRAAINLGGGFGDQRITFRPIRTVDRVEPHPAIADVDLQPITVMLQLVCPARAARRLSDDDWLTRMNESSRRI